MSTPGLKWHPHTCRQKRGGVEGGIMTAGDRFRSTSGSWVKPRECSPKSCGDGMLITYLARITDWLKCVALPNRRCLTTDFLNEVTEIKNHWSWKWFCLGPRMTCVSMVLLKQCCVFIFQSLSALWKDGRLLFLQRVSAGLKMLMYSMLFVFLRFAPHSENKSN